MKRFTVMQAKESADGPWVSVFEAEAELARLRAELTAARHWEVEYRMAEQTIDGLRAEVEKLTESVRLFKLEEQDHREDMDAIHDLCLPHIAKGSDAQDFETTVGVVENAVGSLTAEVEKLRADVVWAVSTGVTSSAAGIISWREWDSGDFFKQSRAHDGTHDGLWSAVRRARDQS